ncbi:hypothetical protein LXL04_001363 [Taraxacum kok-saghyz]
MIGRQQPGSAAIIDTITQAVQSSLSPATTESSYTLFHTELELELHHLKLKDIISTPAIGARKQIPSFCHFPHIIWLKKMALNRRDITQILEMESISANQISFVICIKYMCMLLTKVGARHL